MYTGKKKLRHKSWHLDLNHAMTEWQTEERSLWRSCLWAALWATVTGAISYLFLWQTEEAELKCEVKYQHSLCKHVISFNFNYAVLKKGSSLFEGLLNPQSTRPPHLSWWCPCLFMPARIPITHTNVLNCSQLSWFIYIHFAKGFYIEHGVF